MVSDSKDIVKGSQSRAEQLEVICPVSGPPEPWRVPQSSRQNLKLWFSSVKSCKQYSRHHAADRGEFFLARSLQLPPCANAFCSH